MMLLFIALLLTTATARYIDQAFMAALERKTDALRARQARYLERFLTQISQSIAIIEVTSSHVDGPWPRPLLPYATVVAVDRELCAYGYRILMSHTDPRSYMVTRALHDTLRDCDSTLNLVQ